MNVAECIGCGCEDGQACIGGCSWLRVDQEQGIGVCSNCPEHVELWDAGNYDLHDEPKAEEQGFGLVLPDDPEFDATLQALRSR